MSDKLEATMRQSKRAAARISNFHYHLQYTVPEVFPSELEKEQNSSSPILKTKKGLRSTTFHFAQHSTDGVSTLDAEAILLSALKIYVGPDCVKLSESSYKKVLTIKAPYLPVYGHFQEILEFYIIDHNKEFQATDISRWAKKSANSKLKEGKESEYDSSIRLQSKKTTSNNF